MSKLQEVERKIAVAERDRDLARVADLRYGAKPDLETRLREVNAAIEAQIARQLAEDGAGGAAREGAAPLLREVVTPEHVAAVVSKVRGRAVGRGVGPGPGGATQHSLSWA